jgi:hypothetical protein
MTAAEDRRELAQLVAVADEALGAATRAAYVVAERDAEPEDYGVWLRLDKACRYVTAAAVEAELRGGATESLTAVLPTPGALTAAKGQRRKAGRTDGWTGGGV